MIAYIEVARAGTKGVLHLPPGGKYMGGTAPIKVSKGTKRGWYRANVAFSKQWSIQPGPFVGVDPSAEARRLRALNESLARKAHSGSPGVRGKQEALRAATASLEAKRRRNDGYADLLEAAGEKSSINPGKLKAKLLR
ncbi:unnamed protein product [marine sediment metagenome]|uniref:Uncharacterized protein n=1 Tax=marine sediment metagenome TaxID=412755 RepID=X0UE39_9ZZZZ